MHVAGDAGARRASKIHAQVHTVGCVICAIDAFHALRQTHHFGQSLWVTSAEVRHVGERNNHHMAGGVRVAIKDDERFRAAMDNECFGIIFARNGIAKNAVGLDAACRFLHVLVPPGSPEVVHQLACASKVAAPAYSASFVAAMIAANDRSRKRRQSAGVTAKRYKMTSWKTGRKQRR